MHVCVSIHVDECVYGCMGVPMCAHRGRGWRWESCSPPLLHSLRQGLSVKPRSTDKAVFFLNLAPRIPWVHSLRLELFVGSCAHWHLHGLLGCGFWSSCLLGKYFQCYAISLAWSLAFNQHWLILTWTVSQDVCLMLAHDETEIKYFRKKWHSNHSVFCCILPGVPDIVLLLQVILAPVSFIIIIKCQIT